MIWSSDVVGRGVQRTLQEGCGECLFLKNIKVNFRGGGRRQSFVNKNTKKYLLSLAIMLLEKWRPYLPRQIQQSLKHLAKSYKKLYGIKSKWTVVNDLSKLIVPFVKPKPLYIT